MNIGLRDRVLPENQRRTLEELSDDLDLRSGDTRAKQSAFWTMLVLSGVIATAGVLADSTATVIGAMIIAPLSTPIMGIALGIVKRERIRAGRFVLFGAVVVVLIGIVAAFVVPDIDLQTNSQITSRTSPTVIDLIAAIATGLAGAVGLSRRDVAAVLPGVAIAISLVPPLAVVGICLGEGSSRAGPGGAAALRLEPGVDGHRRHRAVRGPRATPPRPTPRPAWWVPRASRPSPSCCSSWPCWSPSR